MSYTNYSLEVISHHPKFSGKALKQYHVDGINTVGAWGDEEFSIVFKNNTFQKVQVKISLDGTDILTGKLADTEVSKDMWVVNAYSTLSLKAWPEAQQGGAAFIFTGADKSVAVHTHGDLSNRGIIAAAVFVEGHVEPPVEHHYYHHDFWWPYYPYITLNGQWIHNNYGNQYDWTYTSNKIGESSSGSIGGGTFGSSGVYTCNTSNNLQTADCLSFNSCSSDAIGMSEIGDVDATRSLESLASVGAGSFTEQHISYVSGLIKPIFADTVRVKYEWWDHLEEKLRNRFHTAAQPQPSGFPGDKSKGIDLKGTPRVGEKKGSFRRTAQEPVFARV